MTARAAGLISFVTDVEGDVQFWNDFVDLSEVIERGPDGELLLAEGAHFVYGGDAIDKQSGDLAVLEDLLALKRRHPGRVHFIAGNRDLNKLRLPVELGAAHINSLPLRDHPGVYWAKKLKPANKLTEEQLNDNSPPSRLRWILAQTMGADTAFEKRRSELSRQRAGAEVSDDQVVQSFLDMVKPDGPLLEYLTHAKLALRLGSVLFVHGGLPRWGDEDWAPGWLPPMHAGDSPKDNVPLDYWICQLATLARSGIEEFRKSWEAEPGADAWAVDGGYCHAQPGSRLCQYLQRDMPDGSFQPSVVYNGWLNAEYQTVSGISHEMKAWLRNAGVRSVVSGHLPHGDAPLVLRVTEDLMAITADTSYASWVTMEGDGPAPMDADRTRGGAVCEVLLDPVAGGARIRGRLASGRAFRAASDDAALGRVTADGWRVKGRVEDDRLLLSRNEKWTFFNKLAREEDVTLLGTDT